MIILSSFIHPHLIQNLYDFFFKSNFLFIVLNTADFPKYGLKQLKHPLKYLLLYFAEERMSYRFETTHSCHLEYKLRLKAIFTTQFPSMKDT